MSGFLFRNSIRDKLQGIGGTRIFRDRIIVQVNRARHRIKRDVLEDRPKSSGRRVDLRLCGLGEADHFGVAATFEVEYSIVAPTMLIVTDQAPRGICRESCLAGT